MRNAPRFVLPVAAMLVMFGCESQQPSSDSSSEAASPPPSAPIAPTPLPARLAVAEPVAILETHAADQSDLPHAGVWIIHSQSQLAEVGSKALTDLHPDLTKQDLVVVALGNQPTAGYWVRITALQQVGDTLYVQGTANAPGPAQAAAKTSTAPYCAVLIAKTTARQASSDIESVIGKAAP